MRRLQVGRIDEGKRNGGKRVVCRGGGVERLLGRIVGGEVVEVQVWRGVAKGNDEVLVGSGRRGERKR